jgi:hypothetical protein
MDTGKITKNDSNENDYIFSKTILAGKRIYYLDVKQNRNGELFLIITESKKITNENDTQDVYFEKHKIFIYKEEFDKFLEAMNEVMHYIKENNTVDFVPHKEIKEAIKKSTSSTPINLNIDF